MTHAGFIGLLACNLTFMGSAWAKEDPIPLLNDVLGRLGQLQATVNDLQSDIGELQIDVNHVQTDMDTLKGSVDTLPKDIDLRGVKQNWDKRLDSSNGNASGCDSDRFTCLWPDGAGNSTAVRDNETGVVWERSPSTVRHIWSDAVSHCAQREVGGRKGWQLPMREEIASLVDRSNQDFPLPVDHPFLTVATAFYWSATADVLDSTLAWGVSFRNNGAVNTEVKTGSRTPKLAWCVRGGPNYDGQDEQAVLP